MKHLVLALLASAGLHTAAHAQSAPVYPRPYVGIGVVAADRSFDIFGASHLQADGYKAGAKLFAGVDFTPSWGLEAGYTRFGSAEARYTWYDWPASLRIRDSALYLAAKATVPLSEDWSLVAKLGAARMRTTIDSDPDLYVRKEQRTDPYGALGLQYKLSEKVALSAEYERYGSTHRVGIKPGVLSVGVKTSF